MKWARTSRGFIHSSLRRRLWTWRKAATAFAICAASVTCAAQSSTEFHKSLPVSSAEPVVLSVAMHHADVEILYNRDGEVSINGFGQSASDSQIDDNVLALSLAIEQSGNHVSLRQLSSVASAENIRVRLRIDVPYRTEISSIVGEGKQTIRGVLGPVEARSDKGDIKASYVSKTVRAATGKGSVEVQVIGERVDAKTGSGNISGERLPNGITCETKDGDITLMVVGPSTASVLNGSGRIDVGGARGSLVLSTQAGDLHVAATPHDNWKLNSASGTIRLDLPPVANVALDASTESGQVQFERDDITNASDSLRKVGGQSTFADRIDVHTASGRIVIR